MAKKSAITGVRKALAREGQSPPPDRFLSSGSTLLNLACTGTLNGGFAGGHYYFLVGDSQSGKTFLSLTCFAEAAVSQDFKDHRIVFDDVEKGALMDIERYFGRSVAQRMEPPRKYRGKPIYSRTTEDFYYALEDLTADGRPFIYVLDSMDSLVPQATLDRSKENRKEYESGKEVSKTYGTDKARSNSEHMARVVDGLSRTGSILIVIAQTRDNIGFGSMYNPRTRSGGNALTFYATLEIWTSVKKSIKERVKGKDRVVGNVVRAHVRKNRQQGKDRTVELPIRHACGFDDVAACVDYLVEEKHWKRDADSIVSAEELGLELPYTRLLNAIEDNNQEPLLRSTVLQVWQEIESLCNPPRKARYS